MKLQLNNSKQRVRFPMMWILSLCFVTSIHAQEIIEIYPGKIPGATVAASKITNDTKYPGMIRQSVIPTIQVLLPAKEKANGTAVLIIPGGGYSVIVYEGEGVGTAKRFAENGITAFVLKYRLPNDSFSVDKSIAPLQDAQQAMKYIRENAGKWNVDVRKIGVVGFSAGGHLASTLATHFNKSYVDNPQNTNLRPDFQVLVYPVITMQENLTHKDSRKKLLGSEPSKEKVDLFSNELQVNDSTPPAYLTHTADDNVVDVDNSINYFEALRKRKIAVEMHIYPKGGHGFIFRQPSWMDTLLQWMKNNKWLN